MSVSSKYKYLIIGAGRQGTAAAYDLAVFGKACSITLADRDLSTAQRAAARLNRMLNKEIVHAAALDAADSEAVQRLMQGKDAVLSAVPYYYNLLLTEIAIQNHCHFCDMGGNTDIVWKQLSLDDQAQQASVSVIPDCGMGPGFINNLGAYALSLLDKVTEVIIYDAGLPQQMQPPWYYQSTFNLNGLTNEMDGKAVVLRNGEIAYIDTLSEPELIDIPGIGTLEADLISGGASTAPWSFKGKLQRYENKTLRHPKHWEWMRAYKALGLFSEKPIRLSAGEVIPRELFHILLGEKINAPFIKDMAIIYVNLCGIHNGKQAVRYIQLIDYFDEKTGFTAMERLTGWHCAIIMQLQVDKKISPGAKPVELAVDPQLIIDEFAKRKIETRIL